MQRAQLLLAFDASRVAGAVLLRGLSGPRLRSLAQAALPPSALVPAPFEPNVMRTEAVTQAVAQVAAALSAGSRACLVLPDGVARLVLLDVPQGVSPHEYARYRLLPGLPYAADEAIVETAIVGPGRALAAVVRRSVVESYEAAAAAAGLEQDRLDLAPLAALAAMARERGDTPSVDVVLGDAAISLAGKSGGSMRILRNRRRDPARDETAWIADQAESVAALADGGAPARVRVVGPGAPAVIQELRRRGTGAEPGWQLGAEGLGPEAVELGWLGAGLG